MTEIKISELSIGDWVQTVDCDARQKKCCVVEGIEKWKPDYVVVLKYEDGGIETLGRRCIEPIPLTPEILEKNGKTSKDYPTWLIAGRAVVEKEPTGEYSVHIYDAAIDKVLVTAWTQHIHQLQHALRLAGVEKEIEVCC